jgi:hypothetical protein
MMTSVKSGTIGFSQVKIIWPMINSDIWANKFRDYLADKVYIEEMLKTTGW